MLRVTLLLIVVVVLIFLVPRLFSGGRGAVPGLGSLAPDFTLPSRSASSLKFSPSLAQNFLCESTLSTLTPRTTARRSAYLASSA